MNHRPLGSTGLDVSTIALGTVKIGRNQGVKYPRAFDLPDDEAVIELLRTASDVGVNLIDTAPAYGTSETRLGELLPRAGGEWLISTKAGESFENGESSFDFRPKPIRASVERSLKRLGRKVLDLVLLHSDGRDLEVLAAGALDALIQCRDEGRIRACGLSGKTVDGGIAALEAGADAVMVTHNLAYDGERAVIDRARDLNRGVLIKKALNSGHLAGDGDASPEQLADAARASIHHSLATPGVTSLVIGTLSPARLRQNVEAANALPAG